LTIVFGEDEERRFNPDYSEHRELLASAMLLASSLSWLCKPFEQTHTWAEKVSKEFFSQPQSKLGDLKVSQLPNLVIELITKLGMPLFSVIVKVLPEIKPQLNQLEKNLKMWKGSQK
jgi:hypothetical protein